MAGDEGYGEIARLPEGCISHAISLTSPIDSCRSAVVSTTFRSAVDSDSVWEHFLPSDYEEILSRAIDPVEFSSKKELYFRLSDSILIDGGRISFWLERLTGCKCYTLSARELRIVWEDTCCYWKWKRLADSRFPEVVEFLNVCWLEIKGSIDSKNYREEQIMVHILSSNYLGNCVASGTNPHQCRWEAIALLMKYV